MSLRTLSHGTVMCTPLAGRIESGSASLVEGADLVGPHAGGVDDDLGAHRDLPAAGVDDGAVDPPVGVAS